MKLAVALALMATVAGSAAPAEAAAAVPVIVRLVPGAGDPAAHAARAGAVPRHVFRHALTGWSGLVPAAALEALRRDRAVAGVETDHLARAAATQPSPPWGLDRVDQHYLPLDDAFTYHHDGSGVTAYVIDSGVRIGHAEFGGRARSGLDLVDGGEADDCSGHGTAVASVLAGGTIGVARGAEVVAVRVLDCAGAAEVSDVVAGIDWVTGVHVPGDPAVATLSVSAPASAALDAAVARATEAGITVAAAAGNGDALTPAGDACAVSPARAPQALTAGATAPNDVRAPSSNHGACVDLFAPGVDLPVAGVLTDTTYTTASGTSLAAAHVAGVAAVYLQGRRAATASYVSAALLSRRTRSVVGDALGPNPDMLFTTALPALTLERSTISFGSHRPGTPTSPEAVIVTNTGDAPLAIGTPSVHGPHVGDFLVTTDTCAGATLGPAESCVVAARFTAGDLGLRAATWVFPSDSDGSPHEVELRGTGALPAVTLDATQLDFGEVRTGTTTQPRLLTLTNTGTAALAVGAVALGGADAADFALAPDGCGGTTVQPGRSCQVAVTFTPSTDAPRTATLTIASDAPASPHAVSLTGTGFTPTPSLTVSPASLAFGFQAIGTTSQRRSVIVTSTGGETLVLGTVALTGPDAAAFAVATDTCSGAVLPRSSTCTVNVTFAPQQARTYTAQLEIASNASSPARTVALGGTGVAPAPAMRFSPSFLGFGPGLIGTTSPASATTVTNIGGAPLVLQTGALTGRDPGDFSVSASTCDGVTLAPGATCRVEVTFTPRATGTRLALFEIASNAAESPHRLSISGVGAVPIATVTPSQVSFPSTLIGTASHPAEIRLTNTGNGTLHAGIVSITGSHPGDFRITSDACSNRELIQTASCVVAVEFAPLTPGPRSARVEIPSTGSTTPRLVTLTGEAYADGTPPVSEWLTQPRTVLVGGLHSVVGQVTDDITGVDRVAVTFVHTLTGDTRTVQAGTHCALAEGRRGCTFHAAAPLIPGIYSVTASARDVAGNVESPGPTLHEVIVV